MREEDNALRIVSHFPGRLRVRAQRFHEDPAAGEAVAQRVRGEPGVSAVTASARTGSVLVLYDPRAAHADALIGVILSASGIASVAADASADAGDHDSTALATRVRRTFAGVDRALFQAAGGKLDLRTAVPGALVVGGFTTLLLTRALTLPRWYDLVYWGYVTFNNMHLGKQGARSNEP